MWNTLRLELSFQEQQCKVFWLSLSSASPLRRAVNSRGYRRTYKGAWCSHKRQLCPGILQDGRGRGWNYPGNHRGRIKGEGRTRKCIWEAHLLTCRRASMGEGFNGWRLPEWRPGSDPGLVSRDLRITRTLSVPAHSSHPWATVCDWVKSFYKKYIFMYLYNIY